MILSKAEIKELTQATHVSKQLEELNAMGIDYRVRGDGSPVVLKSALDNNIHHKKDNFTQDLSAI